MKAYINLGFFIMALSQNTFAKSVFNTSVGVGDKIITSDSTLVIDGYESAELIIKNFPHPVLSVGEAIEVPAPMGLKTWQKSQSVIQQQGGLTMSETVKGHCFKLLADLLNNGGEFNAKIYEGTKDHYIRYLPIYKCSIQLDPAERDWESNTQVLDLSGNLFYHYFGEVVNGDANDVAPAFLGVQV